MGRGRDFRLGLKKIKKMNIFLLLNALIIVAISILTIYSATIHKTPSFYKKAGPHRPKRQCGPE